MSVYSWGSFKERMNLNLVTDLRKGTKPAEGFLVSEVQNTF